MKILTFSGETPTLALAKAKAKYGDSVMIVSTKEKKKKTLTSPAEYEVAVAIKLDDLNTLKSDDIISDNSKNTTAIEQQTSKMMQNSSPEDVLLKLSQAAKQISKIANVDATDPDRKYPTVSNLTQVKQNIDEAVNKKIKSKAESSEDIKEIKHRLNALNDKLSMIENMVWDVDLNDRGHLDIPPEFAEIYRIAKNSGVASQHLDSVMKLTLENMPLSMRDNAVTVRRYFQVLLKKLIPSRIETDLNGANKKIIMFVGPTGVGKTTTLAKLAARYSFLKEKKYQVGIITLDTFRIGAVEQLMQYAKMMQIGIDAVIDPPEFINAINSLKHCDYILIDTAGSSHFDKKKIESLQQFINVESSISIDVNLVLSANTKYEDLKDIYNNFAPLGIDTIVVTKFDETKSFGNIFSFIYDISKPVSYYSVGQEVPDDLYVANSEYLVNCLLDGFSKDLKPRNIGKK